MSRFRVEAEFTLANRNAVTTITATEVGELNRLLSIHGGETFTRPAGWRCTVYLASQPGPAEAAFTAGEMMREAAAKAGMPLATMTDIHVHRIGSWVWDSGDEGKPAFTASEAGSGTAVMRGSQPARRKQHECSELGQATEGRVHRRVEVDLR